MVIFKAVLGAVCLIAALVFAGGAFIYFTSAGETLPLITHPSAGRLDPATRYFEKQVKKDFRLAVLLVVLTVASLVAGYLLIFFART